MVFFAPVIVKPMEKNLDITKPLYGEQILPVPWPFGISRFHYNMPYIYQLRVVMQAYQSPLLHLCSTCFCQWANTSFFLEEEDELLIIA